MSGMPAFLGSFLRGHDALEIEDDLPSYAIDGEGAALAGVMTEGLRNTAKAIELFNNETVASLTDAPGPATVIRRVPQL
jgi:hypothetical protein